MLVFKYVYLIFHHMGQHLIGIPLFTLNGWTHIIIGYVMSNYALSLTNDRTKLDRLCFTLSQLSHQTVCINNTHCIGLYCQEVHMCDRNITTCE